MAGFELTELLKKFNLNNLCKIESNTRQIKLDVKNGMCSLKNPLENDLMKITETLKVLPSNPSNWNSSNQNECSFSFFFS